MPSVAQPTSHSGGNGTDVRRVEIRKVDGAPEFALRRFKDEIENGEGAAQALKLPRLRRVLVLDLKRVNAELLCQPGSDVRGVASCCAFR